MVNAKQIDWFNCSQNMNLSKLSSSTYFSKLSRKPLHSLQIHNKIRYSGIVDESIFVNISRETFNLERIWKWNAIWARKKKVDTFSSADRLQLMRWQTRWPIANRLNVQCKPHNCKYSLKLSAKISALRGVCRQWPHFHILMVLLL